MPIEKNPYIDEILAFLLFPDIKERAFAEMQKYRTAALAVAKLPIPKEAKERRVVQLQDVLHGKLADLLNEQLDRLPGRDKPSTLRP